MRKPSPRCVSPRSGQKARRAVGWPAGIQKVAQREVQVRGGAQGKLPRAALEVAANPSNVDPKAVVRQAKIRGAEESLLDMISETVEHRNDLPEVGLVGA